MNRTRPTVSAFTLIELLVVITIIVLLLSLLAPAMDRAITQAERTVCGGSLKSLGTGMNQHAIENDRKYLATTRHFSHQVAYPSAPYMYANIHPGDFSIEAIHPYVGLSTPAVGGVPEIWKCPSSNFIRDAEWDNAVSHGRTQTAQHDGSFIHSTYSSFAGVNQWLYWGGGIQVATNPELLAGTKIGSQGILMADAMYRHHTNVWLTYNHGDYQGNDSTPMPIDGINRAFGDGAVAWETFTEARRVAFVPGAGDTDDQHPYVSHNGTPNGDLHYY